MEKNISEKILELESIIKTNNDEVRRLAQIKNNNQIKISKDNPNEEEISKIKKSYFDKAFPIVQSTEIAMKQLRILKKERKLYSTLDADLLSTILTELLIQMENIPFETICKKSKISIVSMDSDPEIEYPIIENIPKNNKNKKVKVLIYDFNGLNQVFINMPSYCHDYLEKLMLYQYTTKTDISIEEARKIMILYINDITAKPYYINMD